MPWVWGVSHTIQHACDDFKLLIHPATVFGHYFANWPGPYDTCTYTLQPYRAMLKCQPRANCIVIF